MDNRVRYLLAVLITIILVSGFVFAFSIDSDDCHTKDGHHYLECVSHGHNN